MFQGSSTQGEANKDQNSNQQYNLGFLWWILLWEKGERNNYYLVKPAIFWNWNGKLKSWLLKFDAKKVWWLFAKSKKDNSQKKCPQLCISIYGLYSYFSINLYRRNRSYHDWGQHVVRMLLFFQLNDMKSDKMSDEWSEKWFWFCEGIPHSLMMW